MSEESNLLALGAEQEERAAASSVGNAALTEASRRVDVLHVSLAGMTAIVAVLLFALSLPVFGYDPVHSRASFLVMLVATVCGIGYMYHLNYKVHRLVTTHARLNEVLVNSLGQGFLTFGSDGICESVYSQACLDLFETTPAGKHILEVLRVPVDKRPDYQEWLDVLFMGDHAVGFSDVVTFFPSMVAHTGGRHISLVYRPIYTERNALSRVVVIATDNTEAVAAQIRAEKQQEFADMICRIFRERNQFLATVTHIRRFLEESALPVKLEDTSSLLRLLHTLKAAVKHFHVGELSATIHELETDLRAADVTTDERFHEIMERGRVRIKKQLDAALEQIKDMIGHDYENRGNMHEIEESTLYSFALLMGVSGVNRDIIDHYLRFIVAVPIHDCYRQFDRELHDLAEIMGKQIKEIRYTGSNPPVLTRPLQHLFFSLTHICRNIIDHGIEPAVTRLACNKDPAGQITIHSDVIRDTDHDKQWLLIAISDDGAGIDPDRVRAKLAKTDPNGVWRSQDDHALIQNIFSWGFSTRDTVTEMSGRGVGMEAIEREVQALGGTIEVFSTPMQGTRFEIRLPYTLEI